MLEHTQLELSDLLSAIGVSKWWYYCWRYDTVAYQYKNIRIMYVFRTHGSRAAISDACQCYDECCGRKCWFCQYSQGA